MKQLKKVVKQENISENDQGQNVSSSSVEYCVETSFFYTSDKFINSLDNDSIMHTIQSKYENVHVDNTDSIIRKNIVLFLNDESFVEYILQHYNITILDLFKLLYQQFSSLFKGPYLKKIRKTISNKRYAKLRRTS